ncbi:hypothetical protein M8C21_009960, partial [Ambrosia artemisiifolia]
REWSKAVSTALCRIWVATVVMDGLSVTMAVEVVGRDSGDGGNIGEGTKTGNKSGTNERWREILGCNCNLYTIVKSIGADLDGVRKDQQAIKAKLKTLETEKEAINMLRVVVNSTVTNANDPSNHVFHIITDKMNNAAMRMRFLINPPGKAIIQVQNIDELTWLNASCSHALNQLASQNTIDYHFKTHQAGESVMNHIWFYLPEIFPKLSKVVFLDDDIVVQKDLSELLSIDLKGFFYWIWGTHSCKLVNKGVADAVVTSSLLENGSLVHCHKQIKW